MYLDAILSSIALSAPQAVEATLNSLGYEYQSDFARRYLAQGRVEVVVKLLTLRFGPLTEAIETLVRSAEGTQLDAVVERILTVQTLEEALAHHVDL